MQFYKTRDFSALITDTFGFFKEHGRNYFRNWLLLNGPLLILLVVLFIIGYRELFSQIAGATGDGNSFLLQEYFLENQLVLSLSLVAVFIIFLAASIISYTFPVLYMKRLSETGTTDIKADEILSDLRNNASRFALFFLGMLFVIAPIFLVVFGISYALMIIIIGFFMLLFLMPLAMNVINFLLFHYFNTGQGFFESLSYAFRSQFSYANSRNKSPLWKYWGSTFIMYLIINVVTTVFTMIPMLIMMFRILAAADAGSGVDPQNPFGVSMGIILFITYGVSILVSFILMNLILVNGGLMYYDSRTDLHRTVDLSEIDAIGRDEG